MDRRLRDLERRARSGDPQAEESLLRQRVLSHDLRKKKLRLAAYLGHGPAESVHAEYLRKKDQRFEKWVRGLRHYGGPEAAVRVALSAVGLLLPAWAEAFPKDRRPQRAVDRARQALADPTAENLGSAEAAATAALSALEDRRAEARDTSLRGVQVRRALRAAAGAERVARMAVGLATPGELGASFSWAYEEAVSLAVGGVGEKTVRRQIQRDLLAWALA